MPAIPRPRRADTPPAPAEQPAIAPPKIDVAGLEFSYGPRRVLHGITMKIRPNEVTALIGWRVCSPATTR